MAQTFISYSSKDEEAFIEVKNLLIGNEISVVEGNRTPPGTQIVPAINAAVSRSDCCAFLLSKHSKNSTWCMAEIGAFSHVGKPIFIYHVGSPRATVPEPLAGIAWARSRDELIHACKSAPPVIAIDPHSFELLGRCGMKLFRIPADNSRRQDHVKLLIAEEVDCAKADGSRPCFRLLASSGHSYIHPVGPVWTSLGLSTAVKEHQAKLQIILESPFSQFALTRALANDAESHHWD